MLKILQSNTRFHDKLLVCLGIIGVLTISLVYGSPQNNQKKVLIIGAGPSGLVAAKSALECGLVPTVLEQSNALGGAWHPQAGLMWQSMQTNISRYNAMFSDFQWPLHTPDFPNNRDMYTYLKDYAAHFKLTEHIHLNSPVMRVKQHHSMWQVTWKEKGKTRKQKFDFVIVASGMFSKPYLPSLPGMDQFKGQIIHSKNYKHPALFKNKRVVIVGGMFSGSQIATDICPIASQVTNVISRPAYVLKRYIQANPNSAQIPIDLVRYAREEKAQKEKITLQNQNLIDHAFFGKLCQEQGQICQALTMKPSADKPAYVTISDTYLSAIQTGKIQVTLNKIARLDEKGIVFQNGEQQAIDAIIFCTGYELALPFFDPKIQDILNFEPKDRLQPILLHKNVFHPQLPNLAFVGIYRGTYWGVMELQARWASMVFGGLLEPPALETMIKGINCELDIRKQQPKPQFPHNSYIELMEALAHELGVAPELAYIQANDPQLYQMLIKGPIIPAHYRLSGFAKAPKVAKKIIQELHEVLQKKHNPLTLQKTTSND